MTQSEFERGLAESLAENGWRVVREYLDTGERVRDIAARDVKEMLDLLGALLYGTLSDGPSIHAMQRGEKPAAITVRGIGRFSVRFRKARPKRMGRNPATGEAIQIAAKPASRRLYFVPPRDVKSMIGE